jgi:hypothetical protein
MSELIEAEDAWMRSERWSSAWHGKPLCEDEQME